MCCVIDWWLPFSVLLFFFFNDTATTEIYSLFPTRRSSDLPGDAEQAHRTDESCSVEALEASAEGDRKSTRLNFSHVANSYAVFCLKKKKLRPTHPQNITIQKTTSCARLQRANN